MVFRIIVGLSLGLLSGGETVTLHALKRPSQGLSEAGTADTWIGVVNRIPLSYVGIETNHLPGLYQAVMLARLMPKSRFFFLENVS